MIGDLIIKWVLHFFNIPKSSKIKITMANPLMFFRHRGLRWGRLRFEAPQTGRWLPQTTETVAITSQQMCARTMWRSRPFFARMNSCRAKCVSCTTSAIVEKKKKLKNWRIHTMPHPLEAVIMPGHSAEPWLVEWWVKITETWNITIAYYCFLILALFFFGQFLGASFERHKKIYIQSFIYIYGIVWPYSLVHFQCKCALPAYIKPCNYQSLSACFKNNTFFLERSAKFLPLQRHHFGLLEWQHELLNSSW